MVYKTYFFFFFFLQHFLPSFDAHNFYLFGGCDLFGRDEALRGLGVDWDGVGVHRPELKVPSEFGPLERSERRLELSTTKMNKKRSQFDRRAF